MKRLAGTTLLALVPLWIVGCAPTLTTQSQLPLTDVSRELDADVELPKAAPQINSLGFSLAEYDRESGRVYLLRPGFRLEGRVREEQRTIMQAVETSREQVNPDGTTRMVVEREEIPVVQTMEVAFTECVWLGDQILSCPISDVLVFDSEGHQLSDAQVEGAFEQERRVILQDRGSENHAYYRAFLHPDVLYIQGREWFDESPDVEEAADAAVAPPASVIN